VVILILGILAALMAPSFKGFFSSARAVEAASGLRQSIRVTQQRAANRGEVRVLTVNFDTGAYFVAVPNEERGWRRERMEVSGRLPEGFRFLSLYFPETDRMLERGKAQLEFYPDGTTRDAEIALVELDKSGKEKLYHVMTIQGTTGYVSQAAAFRPGRLDRVR